MRYLNVEFSREEWKSFKEFAPKSDGARLLEKMIQVIEQDAQNTMASLGSSLDQIRFAQGKIAALQELGDAAVAFASLEEEQIEAMKRPVVEDDEGEIDDMGGIDVGF